MIEKLRQIVGEVNAASDNVAAGSQELSSTAQQMSQGATEQAAPAEGVSSSMEEMGSNIKQNADNALQTEKIAQKAAADAQESGKAVNESVLRISHGDLQLIEIKYKPKDEVGNLVAVFNRMSKDLETTTVSRDSLVKEIAGSKQAQSDLIESEERYRSPAGGKRAPGHSFHQQTR